MNRRSTGLLLAACTLVLVAHDAEAATASQYTVRAPIDGFAKYMPIVGNVYDPAPPPVDRQVAHFFQRSQARLDGFATAARSKAISAAAEADAREAEARVLAENKKANPDQKEQAATISLYARKVASVLESIATSAENRSEAGEREYQAAANAMRVSPAVMSSEIEAAMTSTGVINEDNCLVPRVYGPFVALVSSPVVELQFYEACERMKVVVARLALDAEIRAKELLWNKDEKDRIDARFKYGQEQLHVERKTAEKVGADEKRRSKLSSQGARVNRLNTDIAVLRRDFFIETELAKREEMSQAEFAANENVVKSIATTISLGGISCPVKCRIVKVHVLSGQAVSKGDALFDVEVVK